MQARELIRAIGWVSLLAVILKLLAVLRELVIAAYFGASASVDAYLVARLIPITAPMFAASSDSLLEKRYQPHQ
jgi:peptidoglycan biosynthesis protein MviN/MurJ (putative lipid II flippase)